MVFKIQLFADEDRHDFDLSKWESILVIREYEKITLMKCQWPTMAFEIIIHKMVYYFFFVDGNGLEFFLNNQKPWKLTVSLKKRKRFLNCRAISKSSKYNFRFP